MKWGARGRRGGEGFRDPEGNRPKPVILLPRAHLFTVTIFLAVYVIPNVGQALETNSTAPNTTASVTNDHVTDDVTPGDALVRIAACIHENEQLWWNIVNDTVYEGDRKLDDEDEDDDEDDDDDEILQPRPKLLKLLLKVNRGKKSNVKPKNVDKKCDCGKFSYTSNRIINGKQAQKNEYPFQVSIQIKLSNSHFCGGSIISDKYILTAAHCTDGLSAADIQVSVGDHDLSVKEETEEVVDVKVIKQHGNYDRTTMNNDISLLKLAKTLTFSEAVRPVCLTPNDLVFFNEKATVIGWGKKHEKDNFGTSVLNKADVRVIPMMSCRNDYKFYPEMITSRMFCAAGKITDGCQGDSGGPLVWKDGETDSYVQIGVTSWGIGCGRKDFPGVYVKLIKFLGWIYDRTKDSAFCSSYTPTPDVEISSNGKQKNNKKRGKKNRNGSGRRRRRRKKKEGNRWWRRENEGKGRGNRRGNRMKNSGEEESESESKEDGRGRTEAKRGRRKLRRRQKQEDQDDENDSKENGENRRRNLYRNRGPNLGGKKRNKRKSKNGRIMHSEKANNFNGKIRSGSFKKNFQNGKLFVG